MALKFLRARLLIKMGVLLNVLQSFQSLLLPRVLRLLLPLPNRRGLRLVLLVLLETARLWPVSLQGVTLSEDSLCMEQGTGLSAYEDALSQECGALVGNQSVDFSFTLLWNVRVKLLVVLLKLLSLLSFAHFYR